MREFPPVKRNQWRDVFDGTLPQGWTPTLSVSVIIPTYNSATIGLTLASLTVQDYPAELLEVIVIDDGSQPPVQLGEHVPPNTRLICVGQGWGRSNAAALGIAESRGDIIYWVDSDMILFPDNITEHAKWAHFIPEAATIGEKGFVSEWNLTPETIAQTGASGGIERLWDFDAREPHWSVGVFDKTDQLNDSDGRNFSTHMGACATVTRAVLDRAGTQDTRMHLGEDTEIAYRIWQAGGVFIPARTAKAWHLGPSTVSRDLANVQRINDVYFAQRMPIPRYRRSAEHRAWEVPLVSVIIDVDNESAACARTCVDLLLNSTLSDLRVTLVGPWGELDDGRRSVLADPEVDLRLLREWFRGDARVAFADRMVDTFPSPYAVRLSPYAGVDSDVLRSLISEMDELRVGYLSFLAPASDLPPVEMWNGAAFSRAQRHRHEGESTADAVDRVWGARRNPHALPSLVDLRDCTRPDRIRMEDPRAQQRSNQLETRARQAETNVQALRAELSRVRAAHDEAQREVERLRERGLRTLLKDSLGTTWRHRQSG